MPDNVHVILLQSLEKKTPRKVYYATHRQLTLGNSGVADQRRSNRINRCNWRYSIFFSNQFRLLTDYFSITGSPFIDATHDQLARIS